MTVGLKRSTSTFPARFPSLLSFLLIKDLLSYAKCRLFGATTIRLEASSMCQLQCPVCTTGQRKIKDTVVGWGRLTYDDLKKFTSDNPKIRSIELSNWGEIFLNPDLKKIMEHCAQKNIALTANNGANLNSLSDEVAEMLVTSTFRSMTVSIDGANRETYAKYRINGDLERVLDNIRKINFYKKKHRSKYPVLRWQFVVFSFNIHEIPAAREMARGLGMEFYTKKNWSDGFSFVEETSLEKNSSDLKTFNHCKELWTAPQINWDGTLLGCCVNRKVSFGNVFKEGLDACLDGESYRYMKDAVLGHKPLRKDLPCYNCTFFPHKEKIK